MYRLRRDRMLYAGTVLSGFVRYCVLEFLRTKALKTSAFDPIGLNIGDDITLEINGDIHVP